MDTKELMIGDWVNVSREGGAMQVRAVYDDSVVLDKNHLVPHYGVEPIPLTDEILDANCGRYEIRAATRWNIQILGRFCLDIYRWRGDDHYEVFNGIEIRYVHELQHALRLCGEKELADKLKLK